MEFKRLDIHDVLKYEMQASWILEHSPFFLMNLVGKFITWRTIRKYARYNGKG